ncbi:hypothetical protein V8F20_012074 [Naviculisporaceae sp. PSN 640]
MQITQALVLLGSLAATVSAVRCTEGRSWTKEEYAEFQALNSTEGWAGMAIIPHCEFEESDFIEARQVEADLPTLEARGGGNEFLA